VLQEENGEAGIFGLAPMYQISDWSHFCSPIIMDIRAHPISLGEMPHRANQNTRARARREDRFSILPFFSQTSAGYLIASLLHRFLLVSSFVRLDRPFLRPDLRVTCGSARSPASRLALSHSSWP
jgi:hypothetical protein